MGGLLKLNPNEESSLDDVTETIKPRTPDNIQMMNKAFEENED